MHKIQISKRSGSSRTIYIPSESEKMILRSISSRLERKARKTCPENVHGFIRGRSPVTNAQAHIGHRYTLCFDLEDFFDTVREQQVSKHLSDEEKQLCLVDGAARQGLPTSPSLANLAASSMDKAILKWRDKKKYQFIYTRYADDLAFSYDDPVLTELLKQQIPQIVGRCGFKLNKNKTVLQSAARGRRIITGVAVDDHKVYPTRAAKRRLRAARHQKNKNRAKGLAEWCRLKVPTPVDVKQEHQGEEIERLCKAWKLKINLDKVPKKSPDEELGKNFIVTSDLAYMLGCSTFTTGWRSCYQQPTGQYRRSVIFWCYLRGARVAAFLSDRTMSIAGVERRVMRARALVFEFRNGKRAYGKVYGNPGDKEKLIKRLKSAGYVPMSKVPKGTRVVGHGPTRIKIWSDDLKFSTTKATNGPWKGCKVRIALH